MKGKNSMALCDQVTEKEYHTPQVMSWVLRNHSLMRQHNNGFHHDNYKFSRKGLVWQNQFKIT